MRSPDEGMQFPPIPSGATPDLIIQLEEVTLQYEPQQDKWNTTQ